MATKDMFINEIESIYDEIEFKTYIVRHAHFYTNDKDIKLVFDKDKGQVIEIAPGGYEQMVELGYVQVEDEDDEE